MSADAAFGDAAVGAATATATVTAAARPAAATIDPRPRFSMMAPSLRNQNELRSCVALVLATHAYGARSGPRSGFGLLASRP
jgi:hypothetical protein